MQMPTNYNRMVMAATDICFS